MRTHSRISITFFLALCTVALPSPGMQQNDAAYTAKIREYTTEPCFLTDLVDHLPVSETIPSPEKILGHIAGAPGYLTYSKDIHRYMRALAAASPRVAVRGNGHSEEGRETLLVMISDEANLARLDHFKQITARLADPRDLSAEEAARLTAEGLPIYWLSGSIHSTETGSPEMLMELAYRLAVEQTPLIEKIRKRAIVLITPVLEVDGHDRMVDVWNYKKANPDKATPPLVYWGKYVAHDNNRDGMSLALALSRILTKTFLEFHPQVLHDLHESIPFLYISTGTGPYNAWLDPIVISEWRKLADYEVEGMTKRGVPGVWTHGFYDGWGANYMMEVAQGHNSIGRFYETFGNSTPQTIERTVSEHFTTRRWFRPNPPLEKVKWSFRNNINLQESAVLLALSYTARHGREFLSNFYLKSKRSVDKAHNEGPAAWVIPADGPRPAEAAKLVNLLRLHGVEIHRLSETVTESAKIPAGSYVIRMDQPYSRMADVLLDRQFYNPDDTRPYDDTGWSLGPLHNVKTIRVTETSILDAPMKLLDAPASVKGAVSGLEEAAVYIVNHNADNTLATFRFEFRDIEMFAAEKPFEAGGIRYHAGSFLLPAKGNPSGLRRRLSDAAESLGIAVHGAGKLPDVPMHRLAVPRIALVHSWTNTQMEGWVRIAFDRLKIPYDYISDHVLRDTERLRDRYDVILYGPSWGSAQDLVNGYPMRGDPIPWKGSPLTPNIGTSPDQTDDIRGGMGLQGLIHLRDFIRDGGLFLTIGRNASIPIDYGLIDSVSIQPAKKLKARGSVFGAVVADKGSPIIYGYDDHFAIYFNQAPLFRVTKTGGLARRAPMKPPERVTGRGTKTDPDIPQGRPYVKPEPKPKAEPGEELPLEPYQLERYKEYLPSPEEQPRVVLRFAKEKELLISGMLGGGSELARRPAVVDVPCGKGHVVLFANNPIWRNETQGSYFLVFNAMLNYDHLGVGREEAKQAKPAGKTSGKQ